MAYRVVWSPRAVEDLEAIAQYIAADSEAYGRLNGENNSHDRKEFYSLPVFRSHCSRVRR